MHPPSFRRVALAVLCALALGCAARAQNQTVNGNLTVTGTIGSAGAIDSDSNTFSFGTQGASFGGALLYQDASADTFTFSANRSPASWRWLHLSNVTAMRLDADHQLILYQSNGTTAGITLTPASNSLKLGSHANGTLTADANGVITAGGGFTVAGNFTNSNGSFTGGSSGLTLNAGGTNQNVSLNSSGAGDLVFSANGAERMRIKSSGNVGIGTTSPAEKLDVAGNLSVGRYLKLSDSSNPFVRLSKTGAASRILDINGGDYFALTWAAGGSGSFIFDNAGNIGIGTASPGSLLELKSAAPYLILNGTDNSQFKGIKFATNGSTQANISSNIQSGELKIQSGTNGFGGFLTFNLDDSERMRIQAYTGNVGIGTTTPDYKLTVDSGSSSYVFRGHAAGDFLFSLAGDGAAGTNRDLFSIRNNNTAAVHLNTLNGARLALGASGSASPGTVAEALTVTPEGNVGIGNPGPGGGTLVLGTQSVARNVRIYPYAYLGSSYSAWDTILGSNVRAKEGTTVSGYELGSSYTGSGASLLSLNFGGLSGFYQWTAADLAGLSQGAALSLPVPTLAFSLDRNVGIGTASPTHKLSVNGTIRAKEVIVDTGWADYVFDESYRLAPLNEVEAHIKTAKHLPGIPSAAEVAEHGVSMGDMQAKLLSKVEELTLHMIAQEKFMNSQQSEITLLRQRIVELESKSTR